MVRKILPAITTLTLGGWQEKISFVHFSYHEFNQLADFDYLKNYPLKYFPEVIVLELENSLAEQLKAKEYIENLLGF